MNNQRRRLGLKAAFLVASLLVCSTSVIGQGGTGRSSSSTPAKTSKPVVRGRSSSRSNNESTTDSNAAGNQPTLPPVDDSTATLDETLNWIGERFVTFSFWAGFFVGNYGVNTNSNYLAVEDDHPGSPSYKIDGCILTVSRSFKDRNKGERQIEIVIPFADIDPNSISIETMGGDAGSYEIKMSALRPTLKLHDSGGNNSSGAQASVGFWKPEDVKSFGKAVRHAARLCGGKTLSSPF